MLGVIARVGGPRSLLDLDVDTFVALLEGVVREDRSLTESLDALYEQAEAEAERARAAARPVDRATRNNEIARIARLFGG